MDAPLDIIHPYTSISIIVKCLKRFFSVLLKEMGDTEKYFEIRNFYGFIPTSQIGASQIEVRRIKGILETLTNLILRILRNWRELILTAKFCCNYVAMFIKV